jgi:hypothetical protein
MENPTIRGLQQMYNLRHPDPRQGIIDLISETLDDRNASARKVEDAFITLIAMLMSADDSYALRLSSKLKSGKLNEILETLGV